MKSGLALALQARAEVLALLSLTLIQHKGRWLLAMYHPRRPGQAFRPGDHQFLSSLHVARVAHLPGQSTAPGHTVMQCDCQSHTGPGAFLGLAKPWERGCLVTSYHLQHLSIKGPGGGKSGSLDVSKGAGTPSLLPVGGPGGCWK